VWEDQKRFFTVIEHKQNKKKYKLTEMRKRDFLKLTQNTDSHVHVI